MQRILVKLLWAALPEPPGCDSHFFRTAGPLRIQKSKRAQHLSEGRYTGHKSERRVACSAAVGILGPQVTGAVEGGPQARKLWGVSSAPVFLLPQL